MSGSTLLILDGEGSVPSSLRERIAPLDCNIIEAPHAAEAVDRMISPDTRVILMTTFSTVDDAVEAIKSSPFRLPPEGVNLEEVERQLLVQALERSRWNQTHAGQLLKINRDQVRYRIEKFGLRSEQPTRPAPQAGPALEKATA